jgi:hypothetical protein
MANREGGGKVFHTREVDCAIVVGINLIDHVLEFRLAGILAERAHDGSQLLGCDLTITIFVLWESAACQPSFFFLVKDFLGRRIAGGKFWVVGYLRRERRLP